VTGLDPQRVVEAVLFSAGKPLLEAEIAEATGLAAKDVAAALKSLAKSYQESESALEVARGGQKWAMQLKAQYSERARKLAQMEIPGKVLKTLALIAFHQPLKQSELKDMVGSVVYDHVHELHDRGMITARQEGVTKILGTSARFLEYFGIDANEREEIRTVLAKRVGIDPEKLRKPQGPQTMLPEAEEETAAPSSADSEAMGEDSPEGEAGGPEAAQALKATNP
jgi:segregation and condensation protein B